MARNPFRFGSGERGSFNPADWYPGSKAGADTLEALTLVDCGKCGHANVLDTRRTQLRHFCSSCGADIA